MRLPLVSVLHWDEIQVIQAGPGLPDWLCWQTDLIFSSPSLLGTFKAGRSSQTQLAARIQISLYNIDLKVRLEQMSRLIDL